MDGEAICKAIYDWLERRYPDPLDWQSEGAHCFWGIPLELQFVVCHDKIEFEISNGGIQQFLWNCIGTWRRILDVGQEGYRFIDAMEQANAIDHLRRHMALEETECRRYMRRASDEKDFSWFGRWCGDADARAPRAVEELFFHSSGIDGKRLAWLESNEGRVLAMLTD